MGDSDDIFLKRFSAIIAALVGITFVILFIAGQSVIETDDKELNPSRVALADDRTKPVGAVRTSVSEADMAAAEPAAEPSPAEEEDMMDAKVDLASLDTSGIDGANVYASACQACHMAGAAGAPKPGSDVWDERAEKGLEMLAYNAINGLNAMPAKGGRPDLSDAEVVAAVEHMLDL